MMPQSQDQDQDSYQRLVEAALLAFAEKGFDGASVRQIAQSAKLNPAMIAYHFGNKEGLYEAALRWVHSDFSKKLQNMPSAPAPNSPNARNIALSVLSAVIRESFQNCVICANKNQRYKLLHEAAQKLWSHEMASPRTKLLDYLIDQVRIPMDCLIACVNILKPEISRLELDAMIISIHGAIFFFYKHFDVFQKVRGRIYADSDLENLVQNLVDFTLRGLGIPIAFPDDGA
ncbi:MAG: CerR family C-terminal domain-containing protein [Holophagales bacterium]|jgi:AcrR family transcriptional regulator|nr:CerR family C-terminal domain-containing protein [Holophagales bacterium]